jgi:hypothetical protein
VEFAYNPAQKEASGNSRTANPIPKLCEFAQGFELAVAAFHTTPIFRAPGFPAMPTPLPTHVEAEFYRVVGAIVIRYGFIDAHVASLCGMLFTDLGGHPSQKRPPRPMGTRLDYLGKCFRNKPQLSHVRQSAETCLTDVKTAETFRQYIVHGCLMEFFPQTTAFQFMKLDQKPDDSGYEPNSIVLTIEQLLQLAQTCANAIRGLERISHELQKLVALKQAMK